MTGRVECGNGTCKGVYDVVMPMKDAAQLGFSIWWNRIPLKRIRWTEKGLQAKCTLTYPSCGWKVTCALTRSR